MVPLEMSQCLAAAPSVNRVDMVWFPVVPFRSEETLPGKWLMRR